VEEELLEEMYGGHQKKCGEKRGGRGVLDGSQGGKRLLIGGRVGEVLALWGKKSIRGNVPKASATGIARKQGRAGDST